MSQSLHCVFCFKSFGIQSGEISNAKLNNDSTASFLKFAQQYFNSHVNYGKKELVASLFKGSCPSGNVHSCSACNQMMSRFLDLYNQLKLTELKVNWSLYTFAKMMSTVKEVPSNAKTFNGSENSPNDGEEDGLRSSEITNFRQDLINKCYQQYYGQLPRVKLDRHDSKQRKNGTLQNKKSHIASPPITLTSVEKAVLVNVEVTPSAVTAVLSLWLIVTLNNFIKRVKLLQSLTPPRVKVNRANAVQISTQHVISATTNNDNDVVVAEKNTVTDIGDLASPRCVSGNDKSPDPCNANEPESVDIDSCSGTSPLCIQIDSDYGDEMEQCQNELELEKTRSEQSEMETNEDENSDGDPKKRRKSTKYLARKKMKDILDNFKPKPTFEPLPLPQPRPPPPSSVSTVVKRKKLQTEKQIIRRYANNTFEFVKNSEKEPGRYLIPIPIAQADNQSQTPLTSLPDQAPDTRIKTLSQHLTRPQLRLTAALLHNPTFKCNVDSCEEKFVFKDHLQIHSKLHGEFKCSLCSHVEAYAPKLAEHVLTEHCKTFRKTKICTFVPCPIDTCEAVEHDSRNYVFHFVQNHLELDVSTIGCILCHCSVLYSNHAHFRRFHDIFKMEPKDVYNCESCPAFFPTNTKLSLHWSTFHNKITTECAFCKKTLSGLGIHKHQSRCPAKSIEAFTYQCSYPNCDTKFRTEGLLNWHMRTCTFNPEGIWYKCAKCKMGYRDEEQYKRHLEVHKRKLASVNTRIKMCDVCGKGVSAHYYSTHMRWHAGPEDWKHMCTVCGKKCMTLQKLTEHMQTHEKNMSFVCEFCGAKYAHAHNLRLHVAKKHGDYTINQSRDDKPKNTSPNADIKLRLLCIEACNRLSVLKKGLNYEEIQII